MNKFESSVGFCSLLGLLFIGLKLTNNIAWDWVIVLLPIWGPVAIGAVVFLTLGAIGAVCRFATKVVNTIKERRSADQRLRSFVQSKRYQ